MKFDLKLSQKALLLIAVPLIFELAFVTALVVTLHQLEREYKAEAAVRDVLLAVNYVLHDIMDAASALGLYEMNRHDERYMTSFVKSLTELRGRKQQLSQIASENQRAELSAFNTVIDEVVDSFEQANELVKSNDSLNLMRGSIHLQKVMKKVNESGLRVISAQAALNFRQRQQQAALRESLERTIVVGVGASILLAFGLTVSFNRTIASRLEVISRNLRRLAESKPLEPSIKGSDEIAQIDQTFHSMAVRLDEARQKEQALTQNAVDVIFSLNQEGTFTNMNQAVEKAWGYKYSELNGKSISSILHPGEIESVRAAIEQLLKRRPTGPIELQIRRKDGSVLDTSWSMQWSAREQSVFCVAHDITERKRTERLRQEILAMVSHDLRTPLTGLQVTFELFRLGALGEVNLRGQEKIDRGEAQIARMVSMINDLLDMEKLEAGAFELRYAKVSAQSIIRRSIDAIQPVAEKKAISFAITEADLDLVCDDERIIRVLVNLLHNAIKFSHTNATVTIALEGEQQFAKFIVRDEGRGIAASEIDCIFERFKQAGGDTNANKNSSGLGLAICRAIVEAHRGSIGVESVLDHGSNFWFRLPIDQPLPNL